MAFIELREKDVSVMFHNLYVFMSSQSGEIEIVNHKTGDKCKLKFAPYSYFSRDIARKVSA